MGVARPCVLCKGRVLNGTRRPLPCKLLTPGVPLRPGADSKPIVVERLIQAIASRHRDTESKRCLTQSPHFLQATT
jgi:hypothetical protein